MWHLVKFEPALVIKIFFISLWADCILKYWKQSTWWFTLYNFIGNKSTKRSHWGLSWFHLIQNISTCQFVIEISVLVMNWLCLRAGVVSLLTHWGWDNMDAISQTTFSNAFSSMKMFEFRCQFHWSFLAAASSSINTPCLSVCLSVCLSHFVYALPGAILLGSWWNLVGAHLGQRSRPSSFVGDVAR